MRIISYVSSMIMPFLLLYIIGYGLLARRDIYQDFLEGAREGIKTVVGLIPTLIGLLTGVGILRASGFLEFLGEVLGKITGQIGLAPQLVPLTLVRMFSSSGATGLLLDLFKEFGADSSIGRAGAVLLSSTESVFYCMSVYFGSLNISKTRYTLPGALLATVAGVVASVWIVQFWG